MITRRIIKEREEKVTPEILEEYADPCSQKYDERVEEVRCRQNFTTLRYHRSVSYTHLDVYKRQQVHRTGQNTIIHRKNR